ncbi:MAG: FAD-dependent monooxygenase [Candidatus Thermoplasmatota archaeon]|nr:FAD-dependent monooxygenase [Candidatus Thermoplasmatota archaeon]
MRNESSNHKSENDYDIMIVGAGPAGISTWLHLHKYAPELASRTIVIEKEKFPRDKICGGGIGGWSEYILKNLNINLDLPKINISDLEFIYSEKKYILHQPNCFKMIQRIDFDHALVKTGVNRGLILHENEMFLSFTRKNNKLIIKTNKGTYNVKVLIGADGALSKVRKSMNLSNKPHIASTLEIFSPVNTQFDDEYEKKKIVIDLTYIDEDLQGYIWHVPHIKESKPYMGHGMANFHIHKNKPKANMIKIFNQVLNSRNIAINQKNWLSHPIRWYSKEDTISKPNILLVGDAVGIEPAFGGGIHFALSYGELSAKIIIDAFKTKDFSFKDYGKKIQAHLIGKWIAKCTNIALDLYDHKMDPFEAAREVFTIKQ